VHGPCRGLFCASKLNRMPPRQIEIVGNISLAVGLVICFFKGYPLKIVALCGACLLILFNACLRYYSRRKAEG